MPIPKKKTSRPTKATLIKRAYQSVFDEANPDAMVVLNHLMSTLGVTKYVGGVTLEELARADERRRFGFSLLSQLGLSEEYIQKRSEQQIHELEERLYNE